MQKNVPKYTPEWVPDGAAVGGGVEARGVVRALQRPPHVAVVRQPARRGVPPDTGAGRPSRPPDPPGTRSRSARGRRVLDGVSACAQLVRQALADVGLEGAVKTSGAKGVHVFVPVDDGASLEDAAAATRAIAARAERLDPEIATTAFMKEDRGGKVFVDSTACRRCHGRLGLQPAGAARRAGVVPGRVGRPRRHRARRLHDPHGVEQLGDGDPWAERMPAPQVLSDDLIAEGHAIPVARVQAMHEGKRRARTRREV